MNTILPAVLQSEFFLKQKLILFDKNILFD